MDSVNVETENSDFVKEKNAEIRDENGDGTQKDTSEIEMPYFLSASEFHSFRENLCNKSKDEDLELYKGPKFYHPSDCAASEEIVEDIMQNNKKSLELQRIAKNKDCMKAEWNEELKVAVVPYLKGRATQHMGTNLKGKCALSPEEALFLLEKNVIEVEHNKRPLSVEEAYSVMFKGKLAVEKYEVYSHLSQQGFIVVRHQSRIGPSYVKAMNLARKKQRKRKSDAPVKVSEKKRLTFSGVLDSNSELDSIVTESGVMSTGYQSGNEESSNNTEFVSFGIASSDHSFTDKNVQMDTEVSKALNENPVMSNFLNHISSDPPTQKETIVSCFKGQVKENDEEKCINVSSNVCEISVNDECMQEDEIHENLKENKVSVENAKDNETNVESAHDDDTDVESANGDEPNMTSTIDNEANGKSSVDGAILQSGVKANVTSGADETDINSGVNEANIKSGVDEANIISGVEEANISGVEEANIKSDVDETNMIKSISNEVNVATVRDSDVSIECTHEDIDVERDDDTDDIVIEDDRNSDINVDDSISDYDEDETLSEEGSPIELEDMSDKNLEVLSCPLGSHHDDENSNLELEDVPSACEDLEVTLVRVKKKEKKPLAVIDLLTDDEDNAPFTASSSREANGQEVFEDSDEEIQVLDEIGTSANNTRAPSKDRNSVKSENRVLKEDSSSVKAQYRPEMNYPDTFRKDLICVRRPPGNLLPFRVKPAKEAYVLNHEKPAAQPRQARLWSSYKDMQDYQRERRLNRQRNSFKNFRNSNSGPFRNQNDSYSGQFRNQNDSFSGQFRNQNDSFSGQFRNQNDSYSGIFRNQNDSYSNRPILPFSSPGFSRDFGTDRNQTYPLIPPRNLGEAIYPERSDGLLQTPGDFRSPNPFPSNIQNLQNLSATNPVAFVSEFQKTVFSVASNLITNMLGHHMNPSPLPTDSTPAFNTPNIPSLPSYDSFSTSPGLLGPMGQNSSGRSNFPPMGFPLNPAFSGERNHSFPMNNSPFMPENIWRQPDNFRLRNFRPRGPSFPCKYRSARRKRDWSDIKSSVVGTNESDSGSDIEEVPINLNKFLYSNDIKPLVDPGSKIQVGDCLKKLQITQTANLCDTKRCIERLLPAVQTLEISFDVYLPNTKFRKSEPGAPNFRIIVLRTSDPIPRYSELVYFQKKWNDGASLQVAVVDHGDISFYTFNSVNVQEMPPLNS